MVLKPRKTQMFSPSKVTVYIFSLTSGHRYYLTTRKVVGEKSVPETNLLGSRNPEKLFVRVNEKAKYIIYIERVLYLCRCI